jgi:hypothetical protein
MTVSAMAKHMNVSRYRALRYLRVRGVFVSEDRKALVDSLVARVIAGETVQQVACDSGEKQSMIIQAMRRAGYRGVRETRWVKVR